METLVAKIGCFHHVKEHSDLLTFPGKGIAGIRELTGMETKDDIDVIEGYDETYKTLQAISTSAIAFTDDYPDGNNDVDLHRGDRQTEDFKAQIAHLLAIDMEEDNLKRKADKALEDAPGSPQDSPPTKKVKSSGADTSE